MEAVAHKLAMTCWREAGEEEDKDEEEKEKTGISPGLNLEALTWHVGKIT